MLIVFQFFRAAVAVATHPISAFSGGDDIVTARREEINAVVQFALQSLRDNSPVGGSNDRHQGLYRDSHTIFVNGNDVDDLSSWQPRDTIHIANPVPYSRVLEIGDQKLRIPHHVYQLAEQATQAKYGDIARIEFNYMPVNFGRIRSWAMSPSGRALGRTLRRGNPSLRSGWLVRQPALIIKSLA